MKGYSPKLPLVYDKMDGPFSLNKDYKEITKQNLKMLILTNPGERIMMPDFGVGIKQYLFSLDNNEIRKDLSTNIYRQIQRYMPYISVDELSFSSAESNDNNTLYILIKYRIDSLSLNDELNIEI